MDSNGFKWLQMAANDSKWLQMTPDGAKRENFSQNLAKMLSANQIARIFKFEYLQNRLTIWDDFLYDMMP